MNEQVNLNSAQIAHLKSQMQDQLAQAITAMQLRKWSMEQALGIFAITKVQADLTIFDIAQKIYDFVAKPALEFKADK